MMEGTTIISTSSVIASQKDVRASIASEIDDLMEDLFAPKYKRTVCDTAAAESAASHTPETMSPASNIDIDGPEHSPFHSSPNTPAASPFDFDDPPSLKESSQKDTDVDAVDPAML